MTRNTRYAIPALFLLGIGVLSYAGGKQLRTIAAGPLVREDKRLSALPDLAIGADGAVNVEQPDDNDPDAVFQEVYRYVRGNYVERITDTRKMGVGAVRAMVQSLDDPRTRLLDQEESKALLAQLDGRYTGIGATLTVRKEKRGEIDHERLTIVAVAPGGPADKAGLRAGDVVTEVDGRWIIAYDPLLDLSRAQAQEQDTAAWRKARRDAIQRLMDGVLLPRALQTLTGTNGKAVKVTVERAGQSAPVTCDVERQATEIDPVEYREVAPGVGYLRVSQFGDRATTAFSRALADGRQPSVVLDLRDNPGAPVTNGAGGPLASARQLVGLLCGPIAMGDIVRKGNRMEAVAAQGSQAPKRKVVVLVSGGTANLAELVAAALKEKGSARLVGARTFGDNVFQRLVPLRNGASVTVRAGKMLPPSGADFGGKGLAPDVALQTGGPNSTNDAALNQAVSALRGS